VRILALADSDSYVKWGAALIGALPDSWERRLLVVDSPIVVSDGQLDAALAGSGIAQATRVVPAEVVARVAELAPDIVLVATAGPIARILLRMLARLEPRPVLVTGLPGISIPATRKALVYRRQADLVVLHSRREVREFGALARSRGWDHRLGLATLPFVDRRAARGTDLVFAAQAIVPASRDDRLVVAHALRDAALADPAKRVVIKVRALAGERQTHPEDDAYPDLLDSLGPRPANLVVSAAPMGAALDTAEGLVTVSSTAAIEAVARGIPVIALDTFGVSPSLINPVFVGSGVFGGREAVVRREFRHPDPAWLDDNYFHAPDDADWSALAAMLVARQREGLLAPRSVSLAPGGAMRAAWDRKRAFGAADRSLGGRAALVIGTPARIALRGVRWLRTALRARKPLASGT
jgi:hypothetical protein